MIKGLIGEKLGHSYSKVIHEMINNDIYNLYSFNMTELNDFLTKKEFNFVNVTIPYKQEVIKYLDVISDSAEKIGAVNLIINKNGKLFGYNTDYYGFKYLLEENDINPENKNCLILGTGGTSKTVYNVLSDMKAKKIYKASRKKTENSSYSVLTYDEIYDYDIDIIVNTTPVGMYPNIIDCSVDVTRFKNIKAVVDCVYNPARTKILADAEKDNIKAVNGLLMLVYQAVKAHEIAYECSISKEVVIKIYKKLLNDKRNIVLIGMPGCGKSTIGKLLAEKTLKEYVDVDEKIVMNAKLSIPDIFALYGEEYFRNLEMKETEKLSKMFNLVISTGGGVIKNKANIDNLKANGTVFYIKRDLNNIVLDDNRPLSKNIEDLKKLYNERRKIYEDSCDYIIENNDEIIKTLDRIIEKVE